MTRGTKATTILVFLVCSLAIAGMALFLHGLTAGATYLGDRPWWDVASWHRPDRRSLIGVMGWGAWPLAALALGQLALLFRATSRVRAARDRSSLGPGRVLAAREARRGAVWIERLGVLALLVGVAGAGHSVFTGCRELLLLGNNVLLPDLLPVMLLFGALLPAAALVHVFGLGSALLVRLLVPRVDEPAGAER